MANMGKRVSVFIVSLLFIFSSAAYAAPVTDTIAEKVGSAFLTAQDSLERSIIENRNAQGEAVEPYADHAISGVNELRDEGTGEVLAYVFALEPMGFVVVSPDTDITPIIAYSFEGDFNWEDSEHNALLHMLTYDMRSRIEALPVIPEDLKERNYDLWVKYFFEDADFLKDLTESATYGPLLSTTWVQGSPYNTYCPIDPVTSSRSIVGCVATAMAMIVNYHACTTSVTFTSADNYTTSTRGINITASGASMSGITYPASTDTAARLSYACGVAVQMDYTSSSSGAVTAYVANALKNKFGFTSATAYAPQSGYGVPVLTTFYSKLQDNIKNGKPAQLAIQKTSTGEGHSIVCDGYNSTSGQYHLNYGWGATSPAPIANCWYTLPSGMPWGDVVKYGVLDIKSTCHPSCPDLYAWNGEDYQFAGSLFTRTHSPESEFYQAQLIHPVVPKGDRLSFLIKEIDKEVSYINSVNMFYRYDWDPGENWVSLPFLSAVHNRDGNVMEALMEKDDNRVYMMPGDEIAVEYALPIAGLPGIQFAAVASGYYLWSHETWCEVLALGRELRVEPGDTVTLRAYVNNMSTKALPDNAVVSFTLQGGLNVGTVSAAGLAPGSSQWYSLTRTVPGGFTPGTYTYEASVWVGEADVTWKPEYYPTVH